MRVAERLRNLASLLRVAAGLRGRLRVLEVLSRRGAGKSGDPVEVPMKALGGRPLAVRPGTSDIYNAAWYYLDEIYLPAPELRDRELARICELGSNMGAALCALAVRYPQAQLLGAEPDPSTAALAARNVAQFDDRCEVVQTGIWDANVALVFEPSARYGSHGLAVRPREAGDDESLTGIQAVTVDALLREHMPKGQIDYMHVSIEGSERQVLAAGGEWVKRVGCLRVELQPQVDYGAEECIAQLEALGYRAFTDAELPGKWVHALRD